jgi:hypothetical protein
VISWNRFYDPTTGRYVSADPIGLWGGVNLFAYVHDNPLNDTDLWGLRGRKKHSGGTCDPNKPCAKNWEILKRYLDEAGERFNKDFTDELYQKAIRREPRRGSRRRGNASSYDVSWNNHRDQLLKALDKLGECINIVWDQWKDGKCGCDDDFSGDKMRLAVEDYNNMACNVPAAIPPPVDIDSDSSWDIGEVPAL